MRDKVLKKGGLVTVEGGVVNKLPKDFGWPEFKGLKRRGGSGVKYKGPIKEASEKPRNCTRGMLMIMKEYGQRRPLRGREDIGDHGIWKHMRGQAPRIGGLKWIPKLWDAGPSKKKRLSALP